MKWFYWFITSTLLVLLKVLYRIKVVGKEHLPSGPFLLVSNHISFLDPPIIGSTCPVELHFIANARLFRNSFFNRLITALNAHPIDLTKQDSQAIRLALQLLKEGKPLVIFPEGERSSDGETMDLKLGASMLAFRSEVPIVPVLIEGAYDVWPKGQKWPNLSGRLKVSYGRPLYPKDFSADSKKASQKEMTEAVLKTWRDLESC